jgi:hypothetical protein
VNQVGQPDQVGSGMGGALAPEIRVAAIAQDREAGFEPAHGEQRVTHPRGESQGGQGLAGDLPVHRHQAPDRPQAEDADRGEHHDDQ